MPGSGKFRKMITDMLNTEANHPEISCKKNCDETSCDCSFNDVASPASSANSFAFFLG